MEMEKDFKDEPYVSDSDDICIPLIDDTDIIDTQPDVYGPLPEVDDTEIVSLEVVDDVMCVYGPPPGFDGDVVEDEDDSESIFSFFTKLFK